MQEYQSNSLMNFSISCLSFKYPPTILALRFHKNKRKEVNPDIFHKIIARIFDLLLLIFHLSHTECKLILRNRKCNKIHMWKCVALKESMSMSVFSVFVTLRGWRFYRLMLSLHNKCTPHARTECFIQPKAASVSWLKVDSQLGGWPGAAGIIKAPGHPAAAWAPDPWLKVILFLLRGCKTMRVRLTPSDSSVPLQCVSNRLILAHEEWRWPAERKILYIHNTVW